MGSANAEVKSRKGITETQRTFNFAKINKKMGSKEQHNNTREDNCTKAQPILERLMSSWWNILKTLLFNNKNPYFCICMFASLVVITQIMKNNDDQH